MKKFIGYYIIGANTQEDAQNEKGLMLWSPNKPNALKRWLNETLLGIYWVDKDRIVGGQDKGKTMQAQDQPVELAKVKEDKPVVAEVEKPKLQEAPRKPRQTPRVKPNK
jgi:hypothetical protein